MRRSCKSLIRRWWDSLKPGDVVPFWDGNWEVVETLKPVDFFADEEEQDLVLQRDGESVEGRFFLRSSIVYWAFPGEKTPRSFARLTMEDGEVVGQAIRL